MNGLSRGMAVVLNLASPREQVFGIVCHLDASGVLLRAIGIDSVDDWIRSVVASRGEDGEETLVLSMTFFPMHRVERMTADESAPTVVAVHERFAERVGVSLSEHVDARYPDVKST